MEHLSDFRQLRGEGVDRGFGKGMDIAGRNQVVLELGGRVESVAEEAGKLALARLAAALDDVGGGSIAPRG